MINVQINRSVFKFQYLQDYARYLLDNQLQEFVKVNIRFAKEANLPMLRSLGRFSEKELIEMSTGSTRLLFESIAQDDIASHIERSVKSWIENKIGSVDKEDIKGEDLTLLFYIRRKTFAYFLDGYTKNVVLQKFIIQEVDVYTTQEELVTYNVYLEMQKEKLVMYQELLLEAQELTGTGSFIINIRDESRSVYTPEYKRIFELEDRTTFEQFLECVHKDDRDHLQKQITEGYRNGGQYDVEYRYNKSGQEKRIRSKGTIVSENERPVMIRGVVMEVK